MTARSLDHGRRVLFAGSFNPFTVGHADLVGRALALFDGVVVAVGINADKAAPADISARLEPIERLYADDPRVEVCAFSGLAVDAARGHGCVALLRGVRSAADLDYESRMADINRDISGLDTVLLCADPALASVSSSVVRDLASHGFDVSRYLPSPR